MDLDSATPGIKITGLTVIYAQRGKRRLEAVRGLDLAVQRREIVGFVGPNGAGKTSTIKVLMGFMRPAAGEVSILGQHAGTLAARAYTGYLPEVALYYPFLTARETLRMYATLQGLSGQARKIAVETLLARVRLTERADERLRTYSKGMLQRVGIAQAIMGDPELLILDEVTAGLDPIARHDLREILLDFKHRGKTVFFSSHELSEVALICDRIVLIDGGAILEERRLAQVLASMSRVRVMIEGEWRPDRLPPRVQVLTAPKGHSVFVAEKGAAKAELLGLLKEAGQTVASVETVPGSLEDYFVERLGHKVT